MNLGFHKSVAVLNPNGDTLRHIPSSLAHSMVNAGMAHVRETRGRIREIVLSQPASSYAQRIGCATAASLGGVRFTRWSRLDGSGARIIEHHPRCMY
jgi:hypothetical protein